ncbi:MAG TPA: EAL domain-containing protein [Roseiflexaceae bacterium]|nr:EAL domain-containing protein [Roseiflexaceae bacterium]
MEQGSIVRVLCIHDTGDCPNVRTALGSEQLDMPLETTWVSDYDIGLQTLLSRQHDISIVGRRLGARTGGELIRSARANGALPPILLLLDPSDLADKTALHAGADEYALESHVTAASLQASFGRMLEHARMHTALRALQERYHLLARGSNDGLWDWDIHSGELFVSPRWKELLGYGEQELSAVDTWVELTYPDDRSALVEALQAARRGDTTDVQLELRMHHMDGSCSWFLVRGSLLLDDRGRPCRMAGSLTDISLHKSAEARLKHSILYDALTGLPNRTLLIDRLRRAIERARRHLDYRFAILCLDFDRFNVINDSLGHAIGDQLLIEISQRLQACLRTEDTVARLGGDEFAMLIDYIGEVGDAALIAERIQQAIALPFNLEDHEVFTSASIGIAMSITGYDQPETMLRDAATAMSRAKTRGRARYELFDGKMHARVIRQLQLETDLRRALERDEFEIYYQPIVALVSGATIGFEALVRWRHPQQGLIGPGEFMQVAEDTGLIAQIDWWVLRHACRQLATWRETYRIGAPLYVSVNLSGRDFSRPDLAELIAQELRENELDGQSLRLEITESVLMEHSEIASATLIRLREFGVQIYIDDFGTGYSSLSYLHRFPIDTLKIDRSFVNLIGDLNQNTKIIHTIISLARDLGMDVIAEGIETREQLVHLGALHCDYGQGYFFSRPLDSGAATALLAKYHAAQ